MALSISSIRNALDRAILIDRRTLGYLRGLKKLRVIADKDVWNGEYDEENDVVILQRKLMAKPLQMQIRVILHEGGHRAQFNVDVGTFDRFSALGLGRLKFFLPIANQVHRRDYQRTGRVEDVAGETFAESYARFALGIAMPAELRKFWDDRAGLRIGLG